MLPIIVKIFSYIIISLFDNNSFKKLIRPFNWDVSHIVSGMVQGARNWGCTITLRSNRGKYIDNFLILPIYHLGCTCSHTLALFNIFCSTCTAVCAAGASGGSWFW